MAATVRTEFSPYAGRNFPTRVLWGDTHLHTAISVDAGTMCRVGQEDAFRFARGEEITTTHGLRAKLSRPLDFLVIADHAEMYGLMPQLLSGDPEILSTEKGKQWFGALTSGNNDTIFATAMEIVASLSGDEPPIKSEKAVRNAWQAYTALADKYNDPGRFTALIGFEWTAIGGYNLHRNVIFRGDASVANRTIPYSQFDSKNPEDLWRHLADFEKQNGSEVLAIPHNGNLSNGRMFTVENFDGTPLSKDLAELRSKYEPLIEATQIKGDGEAHPMLSPNDEFADYEKWDKSNLNGTEAKKPEMLQWEYAREALKTGLKLERKLGVNPYKFGMIGSTDAHTGIDGGRGGELLRQALRRRAGAAPLGARRYRSARSEVHHQRLATGCRRLCRRVGDREYARGDLRCHEAQGDLCHDRATHGGSLLRWLGFQRG